MISAFGVEHGEISKARRGPTGGRHREGYPSMTHRGGEGYFNPSPEQVAAAKERRAKQAEFKASRYDRRTGQKALSLGHHLKAAGDLPAKTAVAAVVGGGALYALNKEKVSKAEKKDVALGATAGAAGTYVASNVAGQGLKATLKERRARRGESPREAAIWRQHKAKYGNKSAKAYAKYPRELPDWRLQRALAVKNNPKVAAATLVAGTAAGAAYGAKKDKISKIALRRVWHSTSPQAAKSIQRHGPRGKETFAADKVEDSRMWGKLDRKRRSAAVPLYVSGPGSIRGSGRQAVKFSSYTQKEVVDVGRPKHFKGTLYEENVRRLMGGS